jgi:hypothetical protein
MFKMTDRARAAKVRTEWYCDVCEARWVTVEDAGSTAEPQCEVCQTAPEQVFRPVSIKTNVSRAVEFAQKMAEERLGLTDMNDHLRHGDISAKAPPPIQTAESETITRALVEAGASPEIAPHLQANVKNFFGAAGTGTMGAAIAASVPQDINAARAMAAPAAAQARDMGADPVGLLHAAGKKGLDPVSRQNLVVHGAN